MKKNVMFFAACVLTLCLSACGNDSISVNDAAPASEEVLSSSGSSTEQTDALQVQTALSEDTVLPADNGTVESPDQEGEPAEAEGKALVVYFSHSGNTRSVANEIASQTGAEIFEIVPVSPYTTDYDTLLDVAQNEKSENARPEISGTVDDIDSYDVIYLGYPNWWADMPMVMYTFLDTYDLSGKTVSPFVTSGGSGFSNTIDTIRSMEPDAVITEGLVVRDSNADDPADAVSEWLEALK